MDTALFHMARLPSHNTSKCNVAVQWQLSHRASHYLLIAFLDLPRSFASKRLSHRRLDQNVKRKHHRAFLLLDAVANKICKKTGCAMS
jgi:hypothetical protein